MNIEPPFKDIEPGKGRAYNADCFDVMKEMPDGCVDMILADLPYGTTQNKWDNVIPFERMWEEFHRIAKPDASIVLTASQPFTSALIMSNPKAFKYEWIWEKPKGSGFLNARRRPISTHEQILIFGKSAIYNPQGLIPVNVNSQRKNKSGNGNFGKVSDRPYIQKEGNFPRSVLKIQHETAPVHPTQKPVALFEYLIKTYTNPGDLAFDPTAGSLTTGVAAQNLGRRWVCVEQDPSYFQKGCERFA